ncbi:MAG TPA: substrate-binding domain-containing protein [Candidatus Binatia bacterium]|jgi:excisionase family DNA binding protein|nr:substrate-binding domain-containing protein [Candidatus Binatia bacterium]
MNELLNTKQVAKYLGINEKKVYYLAKNGKIPCTRATGKWTFSKKLVDEWIEETSRKGGRTQKSEQRDFLLAAGSDDPSLGILRDLYSSRRTPASLFLATVGSSAGLTALRDGIADFALSHLLDPETGEYNLPFIQKTIPSGVAVVPLFHREVGLLLRPGNRLGLRTLTDLARTDVRMINRQVGSGTRHYIDQEFSKLGIDAKEIRGYDDSVATHLEVGLKILRQEADAGVATQATARMLGLDFVSLTQERFDILILKERFFSPGIKTLLEIVGSREFRTRVEAMGGYDTSESGRIIAQS